MVCFHTKCKKYTTVCIFCNAPVCTIPPASRSTYTDINIMPNEQETLAAVRQIYRGLEDHCKLLTPRTLKAGCLARDSPNKQNKSTLSSSTVLFQTNVFSIKKQSSAFYQTVSRITGFKFAFGRFMKIVCK